MTRPEDWIASFFMFTYTAHSCLQEGPRREGLKSGSCCGDKKRSCCGVIDNRPSSRQRHTSSGPPPLAFGTDLIQKHFHQLPAGFLLRKFVRFLLVRGFRRLMESKQRFSTLQFQNITLQSEKAVEQLAEPCTRANRKSDSDWQVYQVIRVIRVIRCITQLGITKSDHTSEVIQRRLRVAHISLVKFETSSNQARSGCSLPNQRLTYGGPVIELRIQLQRK